MSLQTAKQQLLDMLKKYPVESELSKELQTIYTLIEAHNYRDILIYNPLMKPNEKVNNQAGIDKAMFELKELRVDSAVVKPIKK